MSFAAFQKMSELSGEFADIEYFEGGALIPIKVPGRLTYADVTLERGRFLLWEDFWRHAVSLGGDEARARQFYGENEAALGVGGKMIPELISHRAGYSFPRVGLEVPMDEGVYVVKL